MASAASGVTPPCDDGRTSCGSEGSSISALCFGSFECVGGVVSPGVGMGFGEGINSGRNNFIYFRPPWFLDEDFEYFVVVVVEVW